MDLFFSPEERSKIETFFTPKIDYNPILAYKSFSIPLEKNPLKGLSIKDKIDYLEKVVAEKRKKFEDFETDIKNIIKEFEIIDSKRAEYLKKMQKPFIEVIDDAVDESKIKGIKNKVNIWLKDHNIDEFDKDRYEFNKKYNLKMLAYSFSLNKETGEWVRIDDTFFYTNHRYPIFPTKELRDKFLKDFPSDILFLLYPEDSIYQKSKD